MTTAVPSDAPFTGVMLVTQTRIAPGHDDEFQAWQGKVDETLSHYQGYLSHSVLTPEPPVQVDWVITQYFTDADSARAWLQSQDRLDLLKEIQPILVGQDDIHVVSSGEGVKLAAPVTVVISMRVTPGQEEAFVEWQRRIAAIEAKFPGFSGYKLEPPIPGVQDDWTTMLRFDSDEHLEAWMNSPERQKLLEETPSFSEGFHTRKIRTGFDQWFQTGDAQAGKPPPAWKMNMLVLLMLYPTVFLFGFFISTPLLTRNGVPFHVALFVGNIFSTVTLGYWTVNWASRALSWWVYPKSEETSGRKWGGVALVVFLYLLSIAIFGRFPAALSH